MAYIGGDGDLAAAAEPGGLTGVPAAEGGSEAAAAPVSDTRFFLPLDVMSLEDEVPSLANSAARSF